MNVDGNCPFAQIISADVVPRDASAALHVTATLLLTLLKAASASDSQGGLGATLSGEELVPWTAGDGPKGIRTLLVALHKAVVEVSGGESQWLFNYSNNYIETSFTFKSLVSYIFQFSLNYIIIYIICIFHSKNSVLELS